MFFNDRTHAGEKTAQRITELGIDLRGFCLIGLARGGVIIARSLANIFRLPLHSFYLDSIETENEIFFVSAFGTVTRWLKKREEYFIRAFSADYRDLGDESVIALAQTVFEKNKIYHGIAPSQVPDSVIICDDGIVSGLSIISAVDAIKYAGAKKIILISPVTPPWFPETIEGCQVLKYRQSRHAFPTGTFYKDFDDVPDENVIQALTTTIS